MAELKLKLTDKDDAALKKYIAKREAKMAKKRKLNEASTKSKKKAKKRKKTPNIC